jgi:hypothetical protein
MSATETAARAAANVVGAMLRVTAPVRTAFALGYQLGRQHSCDCTDHAGAEVISLPEQRQVRRAPESHRGPSQARG